MRNLAEIQEPLHVYHILQGFGTTGTGTVANHGVVPATPPTTISLKGCAPAAPSHTTDHILHAIPGKIVNYYKSECHLVADVLID
ncbi:hypothetical protein NDU88_006733 [Pleurodeles waltl]|uniref:Uncharacterized protein n=1 Tax=Pleurodeles waltl TaxID=8319 RepID=A0AAV7MKT4_PLEWA|nr:hypothetical protein NDU88_006733 [Pleurodeles waltl]